MAQGAGGDPGGVDHATPMHSSQSIQPFENVSPKSPAAIP